MEHSVVVVVAVRYICFVWMIWILRFQMYYLALDPPSAVICVKFYFVVVSHGCPLLLIGVAWRWQLQQALTDVDSVVARK